MKLRFEPRLRFLAVLILAWGAVIVITLWYLQVVKGEFYSRQSLENRVRFLRLPAPRGVIFDRNGIVLADNRPGFDVIISPTEISDRAKLLRMLSESLNLSPQKLTRRLDTFRQRPFEPVRLAADIGIQKATELEESAPDYPGLNIQVNPIRNYPYGSSLAHLLGYVGQINPRELERLKEKGYRAQDDIGKMGVEEAYDRYLRGRSGTEQLQVNARGYRDRVLDRNEPLPGDNLQLTLDLNAQEILDELLRDWKGAAVLMDPRNGDILAMVSHPSFQPNLLVRPVEREDIDQIFSDPRAPLLNRALAGEYPPGSPFKLVVALAALADGHDPSAEYDCRGIFFLGDSAFRCWKPSGHGLLNLEESIKHSCNVYFYNLGQKIGMDRITGMARLVGFGKKTGHKLSGERAGFIPSRRWKKETAGEPWYPGDTVNLSIGQGYLLITPLQLARFGSLIANGGILYQPRIVEIISSPQGDPIMANPSRIESSLELASGSWDLLRAGMFRVVNDPDGTGRLAAHPEISIAGKTGTVQISRGDGGRKHAWFLALAPAQNPEMVLAVLLEDADSGGSSAAPLAGEFFQRYLPTSARLREGQ